jgi:DNA-binding NtrC family response regulator
MPNINSKSILIVDDDAAMLRALTKVLTAEGAMVANASWAGEVMERLAEHQGHFDLIITDLRMPILNGKSVLGAVKSALPEVPVIVMTAYGSPEVKEECLDKGAAAFLEKPLDTPQLLAAIERAFSSRQPKRRRVWGRLKDLRKPDVPPLVNPDDSANRTGLARASAPGSQYDQTITNENKPA